MDPLLTIIIYGYNEKESAALLVEESFDFFDSGPIEGEVVYVDDGSTDGTARSLEKYLDTGRFHFCRHEANRGIGAALSTGIPHARGTWVTALPADGQISPHEVKTMLEALSDQDVSLVISHFPRRFETADDMVRRVFSTGFHLMCQVIMGGGWAMDGVWMARTGLVRDLSFLSGTFVANIEIPVRLIRSGAKWKRVALNVRRRESGSSKIFSFGRIVRVGREIAKTGVKIRLTK